MAARNNDSHPLEGKKAPAFTLESSAGGRVRLSDLKGKTVVLYFYPKDNTPGCTIEANEFSAVQPELERLGAVVLGVSPDTVASHCKFRDKYNLNFQLLADCDHGVAGKYGVWVEKSLYGKKSMGIQRATFLIDGAGNVLRVWPKVTAKGHAAEVLAAVRALAG